SFALVFILGGLSTIFKIAYINPYFLYMAYHAVLAISLFYITLIIYKYPNVFVSTKSEPELFKNNTLKVGKAVEISEPVKIQIKKSDNVKENNIVAKLDMLMKEQKPYKNPNF